jgi:two-component system, OmpR family, sensor histidine kinase ArlS
MKLQVKLALYNAISKATIIFAIGALLPVLIEKVVYNHIDKRLSARLEKTLRMVQLGGLDEITLDQDCSFESYNIFKEEFVAISPLARLPENFGVYHIENAERKIENDVVKHRVLSKAFLYDNQLYNIDIGEGLGAVDQMNYTIRKFTIWMMIAVVALSIFFDLYFARLLLRPFNRIVNEKLKDVKHPSSFDKRPVKTSTYEFAYLDRSIGEMMQKMSETFEMEREFIMNVSHELLTPVSILKNRIENILNDPALPDAIAERLVESQKTLARLTKVVKALLYISKIENEQFVRTESADIHQTVIEILEELEEWISTRDITVVSEWKDEFVMHNCNKSLIHTLLFNLISNGVKYNVPNGKIYITGGKKDNGYILSITDTGHGIKESHLPFIFDRFKRFRPDDEMSYGLGLPIVKTIAAFHDIDVKAISKINEGTTFELTFPST